MCRKRCFTHFTKGKNPILIFQVEFAPQVKVKTAHSPIYEGDDVKFECLATANPPDVTYR